jgi:hypothetical protein
MPSVKQPKSLKQVEHILASGTGTVDFAVEGENEYYTWRGSEEGDWEVDDVARLENAEEDRVVIYPESEYFVCEIDADGEENNVGPVRCYCE